MSKRGNNFDIKVSASSMKEVHRKYQIFPPVDTTSIETIESMENLHFSDDMRKSHTCILSKIEIGVSADYCCFWDRHPIGGEVSAIGCPIKYVPSAVYKAYFSEINKEKFMVKQSVLEFPKIEEIAKEKNDYYETDGVFCSFECCLAFIIDNKKKNNMYSESELLLNRIAGKKINPAPSWRLLKVYGGHLDIKEFRDSTKNTEYQDMGIYKGIFKPVAHAFEQKLKL